VKVLLAAAALLMAGSACESSEAPPRPAQPLVRASEPSPSPQGSPIVVVPGTDARVCRVWKVVNSKSGPLVSCQEWAAP